MTDPRNTDRRPLATSLSLEERFSDMRTEKYKTQLARDSVPDIEEGLNLLEKATGDRSAPFDPDKIEAVLQSNHIPLDRAMAELSGDRELDPVTQEKFAYLRQKMEAQLANLDKNSEKPFKAMGLDTPHGAPYKDFKEFGYVVYNPKKSGTDRLIMMREELFEIIPPPEEWA